MNLIQPIMSNRSPRAMTKRGLSNQMMYNNGQLIIDE